MEELLVFEEVLMRQKKPGFRSDPPCIVCNPDHAREGEYCQTHLDQLQHLDLQCESLFRFQRISRGKGHESYNVFLQGDIEPCGKVLATETDLENLFITVLISDNINLEATIAEYDFFKIVRTFGNQLQLRIQQEKTVVFRDFARFSRWAHTHFIFEITPVDYRNAVVIRIIYCIESSF